MINVTFPCVFWWAEVELLPGVNVDRLFIGEIITCWVEKQKRSLFKPRKSWCLRQWEVRCGWDRCQIL